MNSMQKHLRGSGLAGECFQCIGFFLSLNLAFFAKRNHRCIASGGRGEPDGNPLARHNRGF
jgi:hypothetical protein